MEEYSNHWELRNIIVKVLSQDVAINYSFVKREKSDIAKRNYIRSLFALYEIVLANLREQIASRIINNKDELDIHEIYLLMDESSTVGENGKISKRPKQIVFKNQIKYVFKLFCREYGIENDIFTSGWDDFVKSIQIRHKITHPKYEKDISISDKELETVEKGRKWWNESLSKFKII